MKLIKDFVNQLDADISLDDRMIVEKGNRYFLLDENLRKIAKKEFFYAGIYLGKAKKGKFFPSFILLKMIAQHKANKIIVDSKTEWLFICGRDVFKKGITNVTGSKQKGAYTLILNKHDECLGFGKILDNFDESREKVAVENISDIGDFLRREKQLD
ncbi:MAG TPA: RsmF rRNA methyltransferase first C-terminal domain-containing protein [Candidatus Bathyarchaeia archaeon]